MSENETKSTPKQGYTKDQFLKSKKYKGVQKDILNVLLEDGKRYTHDEVKKLIDDFSGRKVNEHDSRSMVDSE